MGYFTKGAIAEYPSTFEAVYFKIGGYWILYEKIHSNHMLYLNGAATLTMPLIYNTLHRCTQSLVKINDVIYKVGIYKMASQ